MGAQHDRYLNCRDPAGFSPEDLKDMVAVVRIHPYLTRLQNTQTRTQLCNKNIDIHFFHLMDVTNKMEAVFDELLGKYRCKLYRWKLDHDIEAFLPNLLQSIDSSVMRSNWG